MYLKQLASYTVDPPLSEHAALAKFCWRGVQINEFVQISEATPNILDVAVPNWLKDHTQYW